MVDALRDPTTTIREHLEEWDVAFVELDVFGTDDAAAIVRIIDDFALEHLGSRVAGSLFYVSSVSSVHGLELEDGRQVVIKAKPPAHTNPRLPLDRAALEQIVATQRHLAAAGYPCPAPLLGPVPLARGLATVEPYVACGEKRDAHDPHVRGLLVSGLHEHMAILEPLVATARLSHFQLSADELFPQPHGKLFRPSEAEEDTGWVRRIAREARAMAEATSSRRRLGHCDWKVEHVRFRGDEIVATYDWDSLAVVPEIRIVGSNAHGHTADFSQEKIRRVPTHEGMLGFIEDYEIARQAPFTAAERRGARAWAAYWIAYGAWISILPGERDWPDDSWPALLRDCGHKLLG